MLVLSLLAAGASLGCGSGSSGVALPPVSAAGVNHISGFTPSGPVAAGKPVQVTFTIVQPNGKPLAQYATGPGPHTGVHLIFVRKDLADIVHLHPPIGPDGKISETVDIKITPNRAAAPSEFSITIQRGGKPVTGATVIQRFDMLDMDMQQQQQEYPLTEGPPGTYSRTSPALVMVGHWGLLFQVEPKGAAPFTVIVEDKAEG